MRKLIYILSCYFFRFGGYYSLGICRVFLFFGLFWAIYHNTMMSFTFDHAVNVPHYLALRHGVIYVPKGLIMLFGQHLPPAWLISFTIYGGMIFCAFAIIGFFTRTSMLLGFFCALFLESLQCSFGYYWSAGWNIIFLAGFAYIFSRADLSLSLDNLFWNRQQRKNKALALLKGKWLYWPVIVGQLAVALFYFFSFWAKFSRGGYTFDWAFSDNLHFAMSLPWLNQHLAMPWNVKLIVTHQVLWKLVALGHLLTQLLPVMAIFSLRKPYLRLLEGGIFCAGVILLWYFMHIYNPWWMLMTVFFIDWDFFIKKFLETHFAKNIKAFFTLPVVSTAMSKQTQQAIYSAIQTDSKQPCSFKQVVLSKAHYLLLCYLIIFFGYYFTIAFFKLGESTLIYPFGSFDYYSGVYARKPYDIHSFWPMINGRYFVQCKNSHRWKIAGINDDVALSANASEHLIVIKAELNKVFRREINKQKLCPNGAIKKIVLARTWFQIPPYPALPKRIPVVSGFRGVLDIKTGKFYGVVVKLKRVNSAVLQKRYNAKYVLIVNQAGYKDPKVNFFYALNPMENKATGLSKLHSLPGTWVKGKFYIHINSPKIRRQKVPVLLTMADQDGGNKYLYYGPIGYVRIQL